MSLDKSIAEERKELEETSFQDDFNRTVKAVSETALIVDKLDIKANKGNKLSDSKEFSSMGDESL